MASKRNRGIRRWSSAAAIALLCALSGCGGEDSGPASNQPTASTAASDSTAPGSSASASSAPGAASTPILHCASACH